MITNIKDFKKMNENSKGPGSINYDYLHSTKIVIDDKYCIILCADQENSTHDQDYWDVVILPKDIDLGKEDFDLTETSFAGNYFEKGDTVHVEAHEMNHPERPLNPDYVSALTKFGIVFGKTYPDMQSFWDFCNKLAKNKQSMNENVSEKLPTKFTFKTVKPTGQWRSFDKDQILIFLNKVEIGSIYPDQPHKISLRVIKKDIMEDGNKNCKWKWIKRTKEFQTIDEAKKYLNDNFKAFIEMYKFPKD